MRKETLNDIVQLKYEKWRIKYSENWNRKLSSHLQSRPIRITWEYSTEKCKTRRTKKINSKSWKRKTVNPDYYAQQNKQLKIRKKNLSNKSKSKALMNNKWTVHRYWRKYFIVWKDTYSQRVIWKRKHCRNYYSKEIKGSITIQQNYRI